MTGLLLWILRVLVILMVLRLVLRLFAGGRAVAPRQPRAPQRLGGTLVRDPQCGTYVPESSALVVRTGSGTWHFCSAACRDNWRAAQGQTTNAKA
jgi:uncharacterized protein